MSGAAAARGVVATCGVAAARAVALRAARTGGPGCPVPP
jgi:hypothetical protein